jgi:RimJ/RimL family protein N-acetyltransferase
VTPTRSDAMRDPVLLELPSMLETERLQLRPPRPGDGRVVFEAIAESLLDLRRFLGLLPWVAAEPSIEASEAWCRTAQANFLARKDLPFLLFERRGGQMLGAAGLHRPDWATPKLEVGYWCRSSRLGNGFMVEAVLALVDCAFARLGAVRLEAITDEANQASRKVAERCGFTLEGVLRNERRAGDGSLRNTCVYARLAS